MPFAQGGGARLYWKLEGAEGKPALLLLHSIGTDMSLWDGVVPLLAQHFRLLRMDARGHGASDAPTGDYTLAMLAADAAAVLDAAGVERAHAAGVSLGGMIAMELALRAPQRVEALALICTSATMDSAAWRDRAAMVRQGGVAAIADLSIQRFLSPAFAEKHPAVVDTVRRGLLATSADGYAGAAAAIRDMALRDRIGAITARAMVAVGAHDIATPLEGHGDYLAKTLNAPVVRLEAAHLPPLEAPAAVASALRSFLAPTPEAHAAMEMLFEAGLLNRRRVLGDAWVDRSLANRTPFNADFQAMITRIAWHEVWSRPGLDDKTRRFLVLAVCLSLGRWEEFALHTRAGLTQGGFTRDELKEVLMHCAIYAGVPAANTAFAEAGRIIAEIDKPQ
ncbi:MAG: 3-oxoadipate enol-lactonase [Hyphomonadaceae bacterium]